MPYFCTHCGKPNKDEAKFCITCGTALKPVNPVVHVAKEVSTLKTNNSALEEVNFIKQQAETIQPNKKRNWIITGISAAIVLAALSIWYFVGFGDKFLYTRFALPNELNLRSSQFDGSDANVINAVKYGAEINVIKEEGEWSQVKVNDQKGYMKTKYLVDAKDFFETNAITRSCGNADTINETRFKKSLLNYFRVNNYTWHIDKALNDKYFEGKAAAGKALWRIKETSGNYKTIVRCKLNGIAKKSFACIIENKAASERKLIVFIYDENDYEIYKGEFANTNLQSLGIANANIGSWFVNGGYATLQKDAIIANYLNDEYAIAYFDGSSIALYMQPVEYGD